MSREGKSTLAANLAVLYGIEGTRTVFVDMNPRHAAIEEFFDGLLPAGSGGVPPGVAMKTSIASLDLLAANGGGGAFAAQALRGMIDELKRKYERVVIDTPSVLDMSDVVRLAQAADGVVHVVAAGRVPIGTHEHVQMQLQRAGARVLGVVLTKAHKY
jgi:Mrp family chromosome partitioning ATPase